MLEKHLELIRFMNQYQVKIKVRTCLNRRSKWDEAFFSIFHLRRNWLVIDQPPFSSRFTDLSLLQWGLKECCEIVMLAWPITSDFTKHLKSLSTVSDEKCWFQTRAHHSDHLWLLLSCNLSIYSNRLRE